MQKLFHHYYLTQLLDQQKFKSTYLAYPQGDMKLKVLVKIFDRECMVSNQDHAKSLLETKSFLSLNHPHIVPVLNMDVVNRQPYIVTQYMSYGSLHQRLDDWSLKLMNWTEAVNIIIQIAQALSYAHERHIIHSNIKPNNIFFDSEGKVLLTDFRPSHFIDSSKLDYKADRQTTAYMAPEQFIGKSTHYSDQYALACLAYELITGHGPFGGTQNFSLMWNKHATEQPLPLTEMIPDLPVAIEAVLLKALAKTPEMRYPDIETFLHAIESGLAPSGTSKATPVSKSDPPFSNLSTAFPHKIKLSAITGSLTLPVPQDIVSEDVLTSNVSTVPILKKNLQPGKTTTKPLVIALPSSSDQLSQESDTTQQFQHVQQVILSTALQPSKNQRSRRSKRFVVWTFALASMVIFSMAGLIYALSRDTHQAALKNGRTPQVVHTVRTPVVVLATAMPKATVRATATPITAVATSSPDSNTSISPATTNTFTPVPTVNLAPGAIVHSSSSYEGHGWSIRCVNDGKITSTSSSMGWSSSGNYSQNHTEWIALDLGSTVSVSRVGLYPRSDIANIGQGFPRAFSIALSTDGINWTTVIIQSNYPLPVSGTVQAFFFTAQSARYVLVQGTTLRQIPNEFNRYRMQFAEITVY